MGFFNTGTGNFGLFNTTRGSRCPSSGRRSRSDSPRSARSRCCRCRC
ncbi:hypothetical protein, partial [Mycobacterium tuberculosis]